MSEGDAVAEALSPGVLFVRFLKIIEHNKRSSAGFHSISLIDDARFYG